MAFQKGRAKTGGREKGTKNKLNLGVKEKLDAKGVDCIDEMLMIANETEDLNLKFAVYKELANFVYPKRKAVEMTADVDMPIISIKGL